MNFTCRAIVMSALITLALSPSIASANAVSGQQSSSQQSPTSKAANDPSGYQKYLQLMSKLNDDRQCSGLPPQKVFTPREYQAIYKKPY